MKITALLPAYPPQSRVGAWLATHAFLAHLANDGHEVTVVPRLGDHDPYLLDGVMVARALESITITGYITNADIVVSHCGDDGVGAELAAKYHRPNVRMAHGFIYDQESLEGAAMVVFNSHALAASVHCPSPWVVCHPRVDPAQFATTTGGRVTLVNLSEPKGGELFWRLVRSLPHRPFLGVAGGYGAQYVDSYPNADVINGTPAMRDDVYSQTRLLLMPSERETWGMVAVEAMASGIPVIAHPTDGLIESLGDAGIFVDRADGQGWIDEIERLHEPDEWAAASARALARSAELDTLDDVERFARHLNFIHTGRLADLTAQR